MDKTTMNAAIGILKGRVFAQLPDIVDEWLTEHPEITTSVEDGSITRAKLAASLEADLAGLETAKRVSSLDTTALAVSGITVDAVGIPVYLDDLTDYAEYGLEDSGWYVFARIAAKDGTTVTNATTITGAAGYIATVGNAYVDIAVKFGVIGESQIITIEWAADDSEILVFRAQDLGVRNLDYRSTFYVYDIADFVTWSYALTADETFAADKAYFILEDGEYVPAEVTVGAAVPANTYYNHSKVHFEGMTRNVTYRLNEMVDCPVEIALPEIADDGYGAWFEIQMRYNGEYSCTLLPPSSDVKVGTVNTQAQKAGVNVIDLHYATVNGAKVWSLINTHSDLPA